MLNARSKYDPEKVRMKALQKLHQKSIARVPIIKNQVPMVDSIKDAVLKSQVTSVLMQIRNGIMDIQHVI